MNASATREGSYMRRSRPNGVTCRGAGNPASRGGAGRSAAPCAPVPASERECGRWHAKAGVPRRGAGRGIAAASGAPPDLRCVQVHCSGHPRVARRTTKATLSTAIHRAEWCVRSDASCGAFRPTGVSVPLLYVYTTPSSRAVNTNRSPSTSTCTRCPRWYLPESSSCASGFSRLRWIARFSGRAPYTGS